MTPKSFVILGVEYSVIYCDSPSDVDPVEHEPLLGRVDYWNRTIRIYKNRQPFDLWHTLIHEVLHAIAESLHLEINEEARHNELDHLALGLADFLIRNKLDFTKEHA